MIAPQRSKEGGGRGRYPGILYGSLSGLTKGLDPVDFYIDPGKAIENNGSGSGLTTKKAILIRQVIYIYNNDQT